MYLARASSMTSRPRPDEGPRSPPLSAEELLRNADPPPLSEVLVVHALAAQHESANPLEEALQARPRPDVYEPLSGPPPEPED